MKKLYYRIIAYLIDMIIISIITMSITYMPIFQKDLSYYRENLKKYNKEYTNYLIFNKDLKNYYKDNKLSNDEYNKLIKKNKDYQALINKYYIDNKLTKKNYKKLTNDINKKWNKSYTEYNYKLNKYSIVSNISSFIVIIAYFLITNIYMNGMTIGKKIMKLRIVSNNNSKLNYKNYLIRAIILYNPIYYIAIVIGLFIFNKEIYNNWTYIWSDIKNYLEIFIIMMIIVRKDNRGLHELLSNTKVISIEEEKEDNKETITVIKKIITLK